MGLSVITHGKSSLFRLAIFVGLITAVTTIIYLTPVPAQYPQSCSRPCHELDWPMICRVKLTLERFQTLGKACEGCPGNQSFCYQNGCITADGQPRGLLTVNRQFPGPTIEVCQYDILLVDVVNRVPGQSFGVHWRGQSQYETPYMDGVPMITQCPIPSLTTYQYKFRATDSGTHMWQVNTGDELLDTLFGPLIVKRPDSREIHKKLYDTDDASNVVVIHTWNPQKVNFLTEDESYTMKLLINGKTQENGVPPYVFKILAGKRHRFRVLYSGGTTTCPIRFSIDHHKFLVIALDGRPIRPRKVIAAKLFPGERLDLVLNADQKVASYNMRATSVDCPNLISTSAFIQYDGMDKIALDIFNIESIKYETTNELSTTDHRFCGAESKKHGNLCLRDIQSANAMSEELSAEKPEVKFYFFHNSSIVPNANVLKTSVKGAKEGVKIAQTNNITMLFPSSPLISQSDQIPFGVVCNENVLPSKCLESADDVCECTHVVDVPLNSVIELILINQDESDHVFHLHGYSFRVVGFAKLQSTSSMTPEEVKDLDGADKLLQRNFNDPVEKDTVAVPSKSLVALRFKAHNPGYWLLDEEKPFHWFRGMSLVLKVGSDEDLPPAPDNFPKCGNWVGPEYFLA